MLSRFGVTSGEVMLVTIGAKLSTLRCGVKLVLRCRKSSGVNWRLVRLLIGLGSPPSPDSTNRRRYVSLLPICCYWLRSATNHVPAFFEIDSPQVCTSSIVLEDCNCPWRYVCCVLKCFPIHFCMSAWNSCSPSNFLSINHRPVWVQGMCCPALQAHSFLHSRG